MTTMIWQCQPIEGLALERQLVPAFEKNLQHQSAVKSLCDVAKKQLIQHTKLTQ